MFVYICISFLRIQNLFCKSNIKEALLNETDDFVIRAALRIGWAPDLQGVVLVEGGCERCKKKHNSRNLLPSAMHATQIKSHNMSESTHVPRCHSCLFFYVLIAVVSSDRSSLRKRAKLPKSGKLDKLKNNYNFLELVSIVVDFFLIL